MPVVRHYAITATVELDIDGPHSYAQAVQLAEERLARLDAPGERVLNGVERAVVTTLSISRK